MAADKVAEFELKDDTVSSSKSKGKKECVFFSTVLWFQCCCISIFCSLNGFIMLSNKTLIVRKLRVSHLIFHVAAFAVFTLFQ